MQELIESQLAGTGCTLWMWKKVNRAVTKVLRLLKGHTVSNDRCKEAGFYLC